MVVRIVKKGMEHLEKCQREIEWKIISKMRCLGCGMLLCEHDPEVGEAGLRLLFDMPFCTAACAAEHHGYQGQSI